MRKDLKENSEEFRFMAEFWELIQAWFVPEDSFEWLLDFNSAYNELGNKYKDNSFCTDMLMSFVLHQDKRLAQVIKEERDARRD